MNKYNYLLGVKKIPGLQKYIASKTGYSEGGISLILKGERSIPFSLALYLSQHSDPTVSAEFFMTLPEKYLQNAVHYYFKATFKKETEHGTDTDGQDGGSNRSK